MPHHPKGPNGPRHHQPHDHGPDWRVNVTDPSMPREKYADTLGVLADVLKAGSEIQINDTTIAVPSTVDFVLRFERTPHGSMALMIRAEWFDEDTAAGRSTPGGLVIGPAAAAPAAAAG